MKLCSIFCEVTPSLHRQNIKKRHDVVARVIHWEVFKECGVKNTPKSVEENEEVKLLWDFTIKHTVKSTTGGQALQFKKKRQRKQSLWTWLFLEIATYWRKKTEKYKKYQDPAREIKGIWKSRTKVVPVVVGALGSVSKKLAGHLEQLGIKDQTRTMQKSALLGSAHISQKSAGSLRSRNET